jgi:hypothetical protein
MALYGILMDRVEGKARSQMVSAEMNAIQLEDMYECILAGEKLVIASEDHQGRA